MATTVTYYNAFLKAMGNAAQTPIDFDGDTFKMSLHTATYAPDRDVHDFFDDVTNEVTGTGYTAGGKTLTSPTWTQDNGNDRAVWDFDDITWTTLSTTFRYAVIRRSTGTASTEQLVCYIDFGASQTVAGIDFTIPINAAGFHIVKQGP